MEKDAKEQPEEKPRISRKKLEILQQLPQWLPEIAAGRISMFFLDECHLLWGDVCGYVWAAAIGVKLPERVLGRQNRGELFLPILALGIMAHIISHPETCLGKTHLRIEVPIVNEPEKQTYFGALDYYHQEFLIQAAPKANSESTISFLKFLQRQRPGQRIAILWDGATYHRSQELKQHLQSLNAGLDESSWQVTCIRFTPNAPEQTPVEDVWLQGKRFVREFYHLCHSFSAVKVLFKLVTHRQTFDFPKLSESAAFP